MEDDAVFAADKSLDARKMYANICVHDARDVLLENDTRLLVTISFDNDFDISDDVTAYLTGGDPNKE